MKKLIIAAVGVLAGCATSTGVVPMGQDTYMISYRDNGPSSSLGALKASALVEAKNHCAAEGRDFQVLNTQDVPRSFGQFPEAAVQFKCVAKNRMP